MIVDAYTMAGGYFIRQDAMGFPDLAAAMDKTGVDAAVVLSTRAMQADARKGNQQLFSEGAHDKRLIPVGVVYPEASSVDVPDIVAECVQHGAAGIALYLSQTVPFNSLAFRRTLAEAVKPGLPLIAVDIREPGIATRVAELTAGSGCPLVLLGPHYVNFDELLVVLDEHHHVYLDTSWQITPGCIELMVEHAGADRIMFGSGAALRPIQPALNMVLDADLDDETKRKVLAANALRLFGRKEEADRVSASVEPLPELRAPETPAIDIHGHMGVSPRLPMSIRDVEAIEHYGRRAGFEYVVCSAPVAYREDLDSGNEEMLEKIKGRPSLLGSPVISPTHMPESIKWLDIAARNDRLAHVTWDPDNEGEAIGSQRFMTLWEEVARRGVPVFWNSGAQDLDRNVRWSRKLGYTPMIRGAARAEIEMFLEVGRRHPELPVMIGHGLGEDGLLIAKGTPNVHLELSGTYPERDAIRKAIDELGPERIVYGTDMDLISPAFGLGVYHEAHMTAEEERLVMAENARRIMKLPERRVETGVPGA